MFFHTEARTLPIGPQAKACGLLDNTRQLSVVGYQFKEDPEMLSSSCD